MLCTDGLRGWEGFRTVKDIIYSIWELQLTLVRLLFKNKEKVSIGLRIKPKEDIRTVVTDLSDQHANVKFSYRFKLLKSMSLDSLIKQQCQLTTGPYCHPKWKITFPQHSCPLILWVAPLTPKRKKGWKNRTHWICDCFLLKQVFLSS